MKKIYTLITLNSYSIYTNSIFLSKKKYDNLFIIKIGSKYNKNLIKISKNINIYNINIKNNNILYSNDIYKKVINKINENINNKFTFLIECLYMDIENLYINNFIVNLNILKLINSYLIIEIPVYFYNIKYIKIFKNLFLKIYFLLKNLNLINKIHGLIILRFLKDSNNNFNILKFLNKFNLKIIKYIDINLFRIKYSIFNIIKNLELIVIKKNSKDYTFKNFIIINNLNKLNISINKDNEYIFIISISKIFYIHEIIKIYKKNISFILYYDIYEYNSDKKNYIKSLFKNKNISIYISNKNLSFIIEKINNLYKKNKIINCCNNLSLSNNKINNNFIDYLSPEMFKKYILELSKKSIKKKILFHEWEDIRILKSVNFCQSNNIADCFILGNPNKIYKKCTENFIVLNKNIKIINPDNIRNNYIEKLMYIRKNKNITLEQAKLQILDNMTLSTLVLHDNLVDGIVAGSINTTSNTLRPAFQIIKTSKDYSIVSSLFIMLLKDRISIYGDCAININPDFNQLEEIVIQLYKFAKKIKILPKIALLSYSTNNSSFGESVDKILITKENIIKKYPNIIIDGPIQYDAATSLEISLLKSSNSILNGDANIFVFPNLDSGNITYKAVQRTNKITAIGPILQGLNKPINDLSRGCTIEDIIYTVAITVIQCNFD